MNTTSAQSKGKVIISGEHSVVYGQPALVGSVHLFREAVLRPSGNRQVTPSQFVSNIFQIFERKYGVKVSGLEVLDMGKLPIGSGLGSSAAFANAIFLALLKKFNHSASLKDLYEMVQESEKFAHGNPSGVDATAVVYGGLLEFIKKENEVSIDQLRVKGGNFTNSDFYLISSGRPTESTKEMIELLAKRIEDNPDLRWIVERIGQITKQLIEDVKNNKFEAGALYENGRLLEDLGVVGERAKSMTRLIETVGGSAKITGAGGIKEGSGMILASTSDQEKLENLINQQNWKFYKVRIG